jgi:hypothetical protein
LGVIQSHSNVPGNGLHELDVIAGEEITVYRFAKTEDCYGVLANAARHEIVQVQLVERSPHRIRNVSRRAGRLKEERPPGELGPGRLEETEIHRFGKAHAHGTSETHASWPNRIFHEDSDAVDQQGLREAVHHRAKHGIEAHFVGERAAELDQRAAVIETIAVEKRSRRA